MKVRKKGSENIDLKVYLNSGLTPEEHLNKITSAAYGKLTK